MKKRKKNASYDAVADRKDKAAAFQRRLGNRKIADAIDDESVEHYALRTGSLIENPRRKKNWKRDRRYLRGRAGIRDAQRRATIKRQMRHQGVPVPKFAEYDLKALRSLRRGNPEKMSADKYQKLLKAGYAGEHDGKPHILVMGSRGTTLREVEIIGKKKNGLGLGRVIKRTAKIAVKAAILKKAGILNPKRATRCQHPGCDWKMGLKLVETPRGVKALCAEHRQKYPAARTHANPDELTAEYFRTRRLKERRDVKAALIRAGYKNVGVSHGRGTTHNWLQIKVTYPAGADYSATLGEVERIAKSASGRSASAAEHISVDLVKANPKKRRNANLEEMIRVGARVTIVNRFGQQHTGRAVMRGPAGWVLNMGGPHGTPAIASGDNIVKVKYPRGRNSVVGRLFHKAKKHTRRAAARAGRAVARSAAEAVLAKVGAGSASERRLARRKASAAAAKWGKLSPASRSSWLSRLGLNTAFAKLAWSEIPSEYQAHFAGRLNPGDPDLRRQLAKAVEDLKRARELYSEGKITRYRLAEVRLTHDRIADLTRKNPKKSRRRKISAAKSAASIHSRGLRRQQKRRRRNGAVDEAAGMFEKFAGKPADQVIEMQQREISHDTFAKLGDLVKIVVGKNRTIEFPDDGTDPVMLCCDPRGKQLYIIGGDQDLSGSLKALGADASKDLCDLGHCSQVEYLARKKFDNFEPVVYYHKLGEESGIKPRLMFDKLNRRLYIVGGEYTIEDRGIVN